MGCCKPIFCWWWIKKFNGQKLIEEFIEGKTKGFWGKRCLKGIKFGNESLASVFAFKENDIVEKGFSLGEFQHKMVEAI